PPPLQRGAAWPKPGASRRAGAPPKTPKLRGNREPRAEAAGKERSESTRRRDSLGSAIRIRLLSERARKRKRHMQRERRAGTSRAFAHQNCEPPYKSSAKKREPSTQSRAAKQKRATPQTISANPAKSRVVCSSTRMLRIQASFDRQLGLGKV